MAETRTVAYAVRTFAPELWGEADRFAVFFPSSFPDAKPFEQRAVSGVRNHLRKASILRDVSIRMAPSIELDSEELKKQGYTSGQNATELTAVIENVFTELYSTVDCTLQVFNQRFGSLNLPHSTRKTFDRIRSGSFDSKLEVELLRAFKEAFWFDPLRKLRDELTHGDLGRIFQDAQTKKASYMHIGLRNQGKPLIIEDIFERIDADLGEVRLFVKRIFTHLNRLLRDIPTSQLCGLHLGRALMREIRPEPNITFDSGTCISLGWIESEGRPTCPLVCGAYRSAKQLLASRPVPGISESE